MNHATRSPKALVLIAALACASACAAPVVSTLPEPVWPDADALASCVDQGPALCFAAARVLDAGGDRAAAARYLEVACDAGHAQACATLAGRLDRGIGVERDMVRAASLYRRSCQAGDSAGCNASNALREALIGGPDAVEDSGVPSDALQAAAGAAGGRAGGSGEVRL